MSVCVLWPSRRISRLVLYCFIITHISRSDWRHTPSFIETCRPQIEKILSPKRSRCLMGIRRKVRVFSFHYCMSNQTVRRNAAVHLSKTASENKWKYCTTQKYCSKLLPIIKCLFSMYVFLRGDPLSVEGIHLTPAHRCRFYSQPIVLSSNKWPVGGLLFIWTRTIAYQRYYYSFLCGFENHLVSSRSNWCNVIIYLSGLGPRSIPILRQWFCYFHWAYDGCLDHMCKYTWTQQPGKGYF